MMKQRTIDSMKPDAKWIARKLWNLMQDTGSDAEFAPLRDQYHAMFKDDENFVDGTEPYRRD